MLLKPVDNLTGPLKMATRFKNTNTACGGEKNRCNKIVIPYVSGVSEKLRIIINKHRIPVFFNLATHSERNWYILKTTHHTPRQAISCMQSSAVRKVQTYISVKMNNH